MKEIITFAVRFFEIKTNIVIIRCLTQRNI